MKNRIMRILSLLLVLSVMLTTGCSFVVKEQMVLTNPVESDDDSTVENTTTDENVENGEEVAAGDATDTSGNQSGTTTSGTQNQTTTSSGRTEPALSGSLEIQIFTNESASAGDSWTEVIDEFEELTGVKVTAYIGSQVNTQMSKRWMGSNPPDIALLDGGGIAIEALESSGAIYDLTSLLQNDYVYGTDEKIWDVTNHNIFERTSASGKYYRAGFMASAYGTFYDSTYLNSLGVTAPTNYTELMNFANTLKSKGVATFTTYGTTGSYPTWSMVMPAIAAYGQDFLDGVLLGKASSWNSAEVKDVLTRWSTFCNTDGVMLKGTATFDHTMAQRNWLKHDAALIGNGIWLPWEVANNTPSTFQMEFRTSPLTLAGQTPTVLAWPVSVVVAQKAKNLENAKAFVRFLYTKSVQEKFTGAYGYLGARTDMDYTKSAGLSAASKRFLSYIYSGNVKICWKRYNWGDLNDTVNGVTHGLMTGTKTVDEAIKEVTSKGK